MARPRRSVALQVMVGLVIGAVVGPILGVVVGYVIAGIQSLCEPSPGVRCRYDGFYLAIVSFWWGLVVGPVLFGVLAGVRGWRRAREMSAPSDHP